MATRTSVTWICMVVLSSTWGCGARAPTVASETVADFPYVRVSCSSGTPGAIYMIIGIGGNVVDPVAPPPLEARMRVGESATLDLMLNGCGVHNRESWMSTNPAVATIAPVAYDLVVPTAARAKITAVAPGQFTIYVDFVGPDDQVHRTTLGYCPGPQYSGLPGLAHGCAEPKRVAFVTVVR